MKKTRRYSCWHYIVSFSLLGLLLACQTPGRGLRPDPDPLAEARALTMRGKGQEAFEAFEKILGREPGNLNAHRGLVEAAYFIGRLVEVEKRYTGMLGGDRAGFGHYGLALVAVARGPGGLVFALKSFEEACRLLPKEADAPYRMGLLHLRNEDCNKALPAFAKASVLDKQWAAPRIASAHCLEQLSRDAEAMAALRPVLDADARDADLSRARLIADRIFDPERGLPAEVLPDLHKATELLSREAVQQALINLDNVLIHHPRLSLAYTLKGLAQSRLNNSGEAVVAFGKALELRPDSPDALVGLGDLYARVQKWREARENYDQAIEINPFYQAARLRLADLAIAREDFRRAAHQLEVAIRLDPKDMGNRYRYSEVLLTLGKIKEALGLLEEILQKHPEALEALIRTGRLYMALSKSEPAKAADYRQRAQECLQTAHEVAPDNQAVSEMMESMEE